MMLIMSTLHTTAGTVAGRLPVLSFVVVMADILRNGATGIGLYEILIQHELKNLPPRA